MKKHYEKCVKHPRSSEPQPSTASEPQQDVVCDPAPAPCFPTHPAQQAKRPAALQFGPDPPPAKKHQVDLNSHVVRTPAVTKDDLHDQIAEFLYMCSLPFSIVEHPRFMSLVFSLYQAIIAATQQQERHHAAR